MVEPNRMTRARHKKLPAIEHDLRVTRKRVMQMFGQEIPRSVKAAYRELYDYPSTTPADEQGLQGRRKNSMVEGDPTAQLAEVKTEVGRLTPVGERRRDFDRGMHMLTGGLVQFLEEAIELVTGGVKADLSQAESDVYKLVGGAAPTTGSYTQQEAAEIQHRERRRQTQLQAQGEWKAAGIE